jgi:hypothetical protein
VLAGTEPAGLELIAHGGVLPVLPTKSVNLYVSATSTRKPHVALAELIREGYRLRAALAQAA